MSTKSARVCWYHPRRRGTTYCGRKNPARVVDMAYVTCENCQAAYRADTGKREERPT